MATESHPRPGPAPDRESTRETERETGESGAAARESSLDARARPLDLETNLDAAVLDRDTRRVRALSRMFADLIWEKLGARGHDAGTQ